MRPRTIAAVWLWLCVGLPPLLQAQSGYTRTRRGAASGSPAKMPPAYKDVAGSFHGKLKELSDKEILIVNADNQVVTVHRSHKTRFLKDGKAIKASDIDLETPVTVDASEESDLTLTAVSVTVDTLQKAAK